MSDFDHGAWARAKAQLALNPLPRSARNVVDRLLSGEVIHVDAADSYELATLWALYFAGVIYHHKDISFSESPQLRAAHERGLIGELFS